MFKVKGSNCVIPKKVVIYFVSCKGSSLNFSNRSTVLEEIKKIVLIYDLDRVAFHAQAFFLTLVIVFIHTVGHDFVVFK